MQLYLDTTQHVYTENVTKDQKLFHIQKAFQQNKQKNQQYFRKPKGSTSHHIDFIKSSKQKYFASVKLNNG